MAKIGYLGLVQETTAGKLDSMGKIVHGGEFKPILDLIHEEGKVLIRINMDTPNGKWDLSLAPETVVYTIGTYRYTGLKGKE